MKKIIISLIFIFSVVLSYAAMSKDEIKVLWNSAGESYAEGDYLKSIEIYHRIEKEAGVSAELYYNLGNSYFKENKLAKAILYYNKALRIEPTNKDIIHNLSVANALTTNKIKEMPEFFLVRWMKSVRNIMSSDGWAIVSVISLAVFLASAVAFLLSRKAMMRKGTFSLGAVAFILIVLTTVASAAQKNIQTDDTKAIVMQNAVAVKSSPDSAGKDIFVLNEGVKVTVEETIGKWSKITIASGDNGWLETHYIERF